MTKSEICEKLFSMQDTKYRDFQAKLIPTVSPSSVIGVRTPLLRTFAKELSKSLEHGDGEGVNDFLSSIPHNYFDENQLHAFLISEQKDFDKCVILLEKFIPCIDNWATCDQLSPKVFKKRHERLLPLIEKWLSSNKTYTIRFAIGLLMQHFLDSDFNTSYLEKVAEIRSEEYYVNMMIAWYFATALAKQWESTIPYMEQKKLSPWTHNKTIQKAVESFRISPEQKEYLKSLKTRL